MAQTLRFLDQQHLSHVCRLHKALYGLKQASKALYHELHQFVLYLGFINSHVDTFFFIYNNFGLITYLLVYVDDLTLIGFNDGFFVYIVSQLAQKFSLKELGQLSYFHSVEVIPTKAGQFLS